jgi:CBS domain-containing protein
MTPQVSCVHENDTLLDAAKQMASLSVGALPVCSTEDRLVGMITDRDIVVRGLAKGDPAKTPVSDLSQAQEEAVTIGADDDVDEIMRTMTSHKVRRLPVIDGHDLVGIVAQADVARALPDPKVGELLAAISQG